MVEETREIWEYAYNDEDRDVLYGNVHEILVTCKSLLAPKDDSRDDWLRTNIFYTTCIITDKVCKVIIDNWSYENMVSNEIIQKL